MTYSVTEEFGCKVVRGKLPLNDAATLLMGWAKNGEGLGAEEEWVSDGRLASKLGVPLVCGPRRSTEAYRAMLGID